MQMMKTEEHRHRCEVRFVLSLRNQDKKKCQKFLDGVEERRGIESRDRIEFDAREQWKRGNRGQYGVWR